MRRDPEAERKTDERSGRPDSPGHHCAFTEVAPYYDLLMATVPYEQWADYVLGLCQHWGREPKRILDLACGTGKVGFELVRRGFEVYGADASEAMVRVAAEKSRRGPRTLPVCVQDARRLGYRAAFDLVVCLYDSLNYVLEPQGLQAVFEGVKGALVPDGLFVFDLNTPRALRRNMFTQNNLHEQTPLHYDWKSSYDEANRICTVDMAFVWDDGRERREFRELHRQRAYELKEVTKLLEGAGLGCLATYDALTFRAPTRWTARAYFVVGKL